MGPNASGKSNLLDALRFISEIAKPGSGGLQAAVERRDGISALRCLHARNPAYIEIELTIGTNVSPGHWRYLLRINNGGKERLPTVRLEQVTCAGESVVNRQRATGDDQLEYSQTSLEQVGQSIRFRPLIEFLSSCRYLHVVPQIVRDRTRAKASGDDPYGGDLLGRIKDMPKKMREPRLQRMATALKIAVPQFNSIQLEDDAQGVPHLWASFTHWRATNARQSESYFSDGTLRLIGLLWSIAERGGPLLLEEPELSLNDAVVSQLPRHVPQDAKIVRSTGHHDDTFVRDAGQRVSRLKRGPPHLCRRERQRRRDDDRQPNRNCSSGGRPVHK